MKVEFDHTHYTQENRRHSLPDEIPRHGWGSDYWASRFVNRVSAWNRAEASRRMTRVNTWADRLCRQNPSESFKVRTCRSEIVEKYTKRLGVNPAQLTLI